MAIVLGLDFSPHSLTAAEAAAALARGLGDELVLVPCSPRQKGISSDSLKATRTANDLALLNRVWCLSACCHQSLKIGNLAEPSDELTSDGAQVRRLRHVKRQTPNDPKKISRYSSSLLREPFNYLVHLYG